jgi:RimJ/RimL family protein N-acetyltransferase
MFVHLLASYHRPMFRPDRPVETARLILRPFTPDDFDDLYAYQSRPDVARYLHWDARDHAQVRDALVRQCGETSLSAEGDWLTFAVVWREAGKVVGEVGLKLVSRESRQGEIGFVFNPDHHGRGLATEAAEAMLMLGFDTIGWHRIIGSCDARNHTRPHGSWSGSACAWRRGSCTTRSSRDSGLTNSCRPPSMMSGEHGSLQRKP